MNIKILFFTLLCGLWLGPDSIAQEEPASRITTSIDSSHAPELIMIQEFVVHAPLDSVWTAYTTKRGWESWAVPLAEVDLKVNGTIKTNYNPIGTIGDSTTIVTHIINYVPRRLLTLQAEMTANFPAFMKEDEEDFFNVIIFEPVEKGTRVVSYGIGYKTTPKYLSLMQFFIQGNEMGLLKLIQVLEEG